MKYVKRLFGILLILLAFFGAAYISEWLFFIKAIADIVNAVITGWVLSDIFTALGKIFLGFPVTYILSFVIGVVGLYLTCADIKH